MAVSNRMAISRMLHLICIMSLLWRSTHFVYVVASSQEYLSAVKMSIDGVYTLDYLDGVQTFFNYTSGDWELSTFEVDMTGGSRRDYSWFHTLPGLRDQYVVRDTIVTEAWEENRTIVLKNTLS